MINSIKVKYIDIEVNSECRTFQNVEISFDVVNNCNKLYIKTRELRIYEFDLDEGCHIFMKLNNK